MSFAEIHPAEAVTVLPDGDVILLPSATVLVVVLVS
jgi:hypothetical protein